ncbi:MAG: hypothetical protein O2816_16470, partial [Planctomycetota bacterium]|nr:hypothetical protein [Planctomycetota bacterium]
MRRSSALLTLLGAACAPRALPLPPADLHVVAVERGELLCVAAGRGDVVLGSSNDRVRRWSLPGEQLEGEGQGHRRGVTCIAQGSRGRVISGGPDRSVRVWSAELEQELELRGPTRPLACVGLRPDGAAVAASMAG